MTLEELQRVCESVIQNHSKGWDGFRWKTEEDLHEQLRLNGSFSRIFDPATVLKLLRVVKAARDLYQRDLHGGEWREVRQARIAFDNALKDLEE